MLIEVQKKVTETVEFKTPAYYKDYINNLHFINDAGQVITVRPRMINMWSAEDGNAYNEQIDDILQRSAPCTKEEFHNAYAEVSAKLALAADAVEF
jgi:electron transfer flavoprotein alpha subunit